MPANTSTGDPAPLGLVGFGLTTVLLSTINAGLLPSGGVAVVIPLAIAFGGTMQIVAGLLAYKEGNTFETVAFNSYGAFWWWFGLMELFSSAGVVDLSGQTPVIGFTLMLWGVFTTYMWVATFRLNWTLLALFGLLATTFYLLGLGDFLGIGWLPVAGGYVGIVTGLLAMYASFAEVLNWTFDDTVLPLGSTPLDSDQGPSAGPAD